MSSRRVPSEAYSCQTARSKQLLFIPSENFNLAGLPLWVECNQDLAYQTGKATGQFTPVLFQLSSIFWLILILSLIWGMVETTVLKNKSHCNSEM